MEPKGEQQEEEQPQQEIPWSLVVGRRQKYLTVKNFAALYQ